MGETRVDLQHLLEDLRDAYTGALEETILTEIVANALDSGATRIRIGSDATASTLTIVDNGRGMRRKDLARYHDVAASSKRRGEGIGFAGVGIKLGLLVAQEVVTETRRGATHVATRWHLASRYRAPWKWIPPPGFTESRGTAVRLVLTNGLSPLLDAGYLEETIRRHFEPLLDPFFDELLRRQYPHGIQFEVDGAVLARVSPNGIERVPIAIRLGRRRIPSVTGFIQRGHPAGRGDGLAISTFGKIIKRGWEWLGLGSSAESGVTGLLEAPDLAASLTLSKNDFIRSGARGAAYLAYRKAIQEVVGRQLAAWGDRRDADVRPRAVRLERDLERVLSDLADEFPLLQSLMERRAGGQKRLPIAGRGDVRVPAPLFADVPAAQDDESIDAGVPGTDAPMQPLAGEPSTAPPAATPAPGPGVQPGEPGAERGGEPPQAASPEPAVATPEQPAQHAAATSGTFDTVPGRRRPARYGLLVQFESRPGDPELGRLVDNTVWINDAHPAYARAVASRSLGYHTALAVALALAPLAVDAREEHGFITRFLEGWGGAQHAATRRRTRRATRTA